MRDSELESMRRDWTQGARRLAAARERDPQRVAAYDRVCAAIRRDLRQRIGQTYSLRELGRAYAASAGWTRDIAQQTVPDAVYAHDLSVTADAVFAEAARGASDWSP